MRSELVPIICMWKEMYNKQNRVVAEELISAAEKDLTHSVRATICLDCDGSREYAEKIKCRNYTPKVKNGK